MLDTDTKKRIDSARDILVGKVPDPKSQVEQITIAMIYKFMDDMDRHSKELGGKAKFFSEEHAKYAWSKIFDPRMSGVEVVNTYGEAIQKMNQNPNIPQLFRDIFKNAYLPYRDPETLKSFLKEINTFEYDHSERLGDAFEYLLSVLGSQGDAGQFRTPRHIIDFMVEILAPQKHEVILDPACGTAGFLISAYKYILKINSKNYDPKDDKRSFELQDVNLAEITINGKKYKGDKLTSDERKQLMENVIGYDISPDMIRLSLVNMYLHGFSSPKIIEYDTLTREDRWGEYADVILANPPFMSPKGGIRPHKKFSIQSKRSEALFVDYIVEHITSSGRASVIVPDGIVANPSAEYKKLRKMLIENGLFAVVSLHGSVFKPYAGAKTSVLFFDKRIKNPKAILFARVDNDGFELGDQRRPIAENDLPLVAAEVKRFRNCIGEAEQFVPHDSQRVAVVPISKIEDGYSLFANAYICSRNEQQVGNFLPIGELFFIEKGTLQSTKKADGVYDFITAADTWSKHNTFTHDVEALVFAMGASGSLGRTHYVKGKFIASDLCFILTPRNPEKVNLRFYHAYFNVIRAEIVSALAKGASKLSINKGDFERYKILYLSPVKQQRLGQLIDEQSKTIDGLKKTILKHENEINGLIQDELTASHL